MNMQTHPDLGDIPAHWGVAELGEVADVTKLAGYEFTKHIEYIEDGDIIALRSLNVADGQLDLSNVKRISRAVSEELPRSKLFINDLLLTYTGSKLGDTALIDFNDTYHLAPNVCRLRANEDEDAYFLYVYLRSKVFANLLETYKVGSGQPTVPMKNIRRIPLPWPPKEERINIGVIFSSLTDKIELNRQTNQTLEHIAQAIFKSWFVDFEPTRAKIAAKQNGQETECAAMAAISGKSIDELDQLSAEQQEQLKTTAALFPDAVVDSELGEIPVGWEVKSLDVIAHYQNGLALQKFRPEDDEDFLPVLKIAQLKKGFADGKEKATANIKPECIVTNGDVVFSWSGSLMVDVWSGGKAALNQHLFKVTSKNYPKWFYYHWTKYHLGTFQQIAAAKAVTMGHIKRSHLAEAKCVVPSCDLDNFGLVADFLEKQIEQRLESTSLQEIRDLLLPRLLSGDIAIM